MRSPHRSAVALVVAVALATVVATGSAGASVPEIGRCLVASPPGSGLYENAACIGGPKPGSNYEWFASTGLGQFGAFSISGGVTTIETTSGFKIVCQSVAGEGTYKLPATVRAGMFFNGCVEPLSAGKCGTVPNTGSIEAVQEGDLGLIKGVGTVTVGVDLKPVPGFFPPFTCPTPNGNAELEVTGSVIAHVAAIDKMVKKFTLGYVGKKGKQTPTHFEGGPLDTPFLAFPKIALTEPADIASKDVLNHGELLEIKAKP